MKKYIVGLLLLCSIAQESKPVFKDVILPLGVIVGCGATLWYMNKTDDAPEEVIVAPLTGENIITEPAPLEEDAEAREEEGVEERAEKPVTAQEETASEVEAPFILNHEIIKKIARAASEEEIDLETLREAQVLCLKIENLRQLYTGCSTCLKDGLRFPDEIVILPCMHIICLHCVNCLRQKACPECRHNFLQRTLRRVDQYFERRILQTPEDFAKLQRERIEARLATFVGEAAEAALPEETEMSEEEVLAAVMQASLATAQEEERRRQEEADNAPLVFAPRQTVQPLEAVATEEERPVQPEESREQRRARIAQAAERRQQEQRRETPDTPTEETDAEATPAEVETTRITAFFNRLFNRS